MQFSCETDQGILAVGHWYKNCQYAGEALKKIPASDFPNSEQGVTGKNLIINHMAGVIVFFCAHRAFISNC